MHRLTDIRLTEETSKSSDHCLTEQVYFTHTPYTYFREMMLFVARVIHYTTMHKLITWDVKYKYMYTYR